MASSTVMLFLLIFAFSTISLCNSADCRQLGCVNGDNCDPLTGQCSCDPGWAGPLCTIGVATTACSSNPCKNGKCVLNSATRNGYYCLCDDRFQGENCDVDKDECSFTVCESGGKCVNRSPNGSLPSAVDPGFVCICPDYRTGKKCEIEIDICNRTFTGQDPYCKNGGVCSASVCACRDGWSGRTCEKAIPMKQQLFDSGCTTSNSIATYCQSRFADGKCDIECASESCFFDGFDCLRQDTEQGDARPKACRNHNLCARVFNDGVCNKECNVAECAFDGGDCEDPNSLIRSEDSQLVGVSVLAPPSVVLMNLRWLQSDLAQRLFNAHVKVASDGWGRLIFEWDSEGEEGTIQGLGRRVPTSDEELIARNYSTAPGTMVFFDIDTKGCRLSKRRQNKYARNATVNCFESVTLAVQFLSIQMARNRIKIGAMAISTVTALEKNPPSWRYAIPWLFVVIIVLLMVLWIGIVFVIVRVRKRKRKLVTAPVWSIPSEFAYHPPTPPYSSDGPPEHQIQKTSNSDPSKVVYPPLMSEDPALLIAISSGDLETVSEMITSVQEVVDAVDGQGLGPLHHAVANNDVEMLKLLVDSDQFDVFDRNSLGQIPLVYAASVGHPQLDCYTVLVHAMGRKRMENKEAQGGEEMDGGDTVGKSSNGFWLPLRGEHTVGSEGLVDNLGRNAVHYAAINNIPHLIHYLVAYGADVNLTDEQGSTPLHLACKQGHVESVSALLDCKADLTAGDAYDCTPLELAENRAQWAVIELLNTRKMKGAAGDCSTPTLRGSSKRIKRPRVIPSVGANPKLNRRTSSDGYHSIGSSFDRGDTLTRSNNGLTVPLINGPPSVIEQIRIDSEKKQPPPDFGAGDYRRLSTPTLKWSSKEREESQRSRGKEGQRSRGKGDQPNVAILTPPAKVLGLGGYATRSNTLPVQSTSPIYSSIYDVLSPPGSSGGPPSSARPPAPSPSHTINSDYDSLPSPYSLPPVMTTFKS